MCRATAALPAALPMPLDISPRFRFPFPMRLLLLGDLGPYPERMAAFLDAGHHLSYVCTGYLPPLDRLPRLPALHFRELGATTEQAADALAARIRADRVDVVYSLLNVWDGSAQATAALLRRGCPVPLVRHYKEHYLRPWDDERVSIEQSAGAVFINEEARRYFAGVYRLPARTACLDADLLPRRYLAGRLRPKLSAADGRPHVLIAGSATDDGGRYDYRELIKELVACRAHVHLYGLFRRLQGTGNLRADGEVEVAYRGLASGEYLHLHAPVPPARFVEEWSCYDAGLLHVPRADDPFRAQNMPNRYSAYLAAGVPVAVPRGQMPAMERHLEALGACVVFEGAADLAARLPDGGASARALKAREAVTFEAVAPALLEFLKASV